MPSTSVLLIEDDPEVGHLLVDIFDLHGLAATLVSDPREIPEHVAPAVVITDLFGSAWYDRALACEQLIRMRERFPDVPLILLTAHAAAVQDRKLLPADAVMEKPFEIDALTELVSSFGITRRAFAGADQQVEA